MHDANGTELQAGDRVMLTAKIKEIYASEDYCNAELVLDKPMPGEGSGPTQISGVNTRQTVLIERGPPA
jgi:hypothetical protein